MGELKTIMYKPRTARENSEALKKIVKLRGLDTDDVIDMISDDGIKEALEQLETTCACGNSLGEFDDGICKECR